MFIHRTNLCRTLVASLLVGLIVAGGSNCPLMGGNCGPAGNANSHCRCGPDCDGHCGAACCQSPAPSQDRKPATPRVADELTQIWGLPLVSTAIESPAAVANQAVPALSVLCPANDSLLALCVRLNV